jgi:hypothetical protein
MSKVNRDVVAEMPAAPKEMGGIQKHMIPPCGKPLTYPPGDMRRFSDGMERMMRAEEDLFMSTNNMDFSNDLTQGPPGATRFVRGRKSQE